MNILNSTPKRGQKIEYNKEIMFKGIERVKATIVGILDNKMILDNGDVLTFFVG